MSSPDNWVGFDPQQLVEHLSRDFPVPDTYWVGFSGGLDSMALLCALAGQRDQLPAGLRAVHVDHGLNDDSPRWAAHCAHVCDGLGIDLTVCSVDARPAQGESPEAAARAARYTAIEALLGSAGMLLTAHHRDDQAETVLLQLMRGAGVAGLAAMPVLRGLGDGWHARPLLDVSRQQLRTWVEAERLDWIEDPSNRSLDPDRNYLRHVILPALQSRWPAATRSLARSAGHCATALAVLHEQAEADLQQVSLADSRLDLTRLAHLSPARQRGVLLSWFKQNSLPAPGSSTLLEMQRQLLRARQDAAVCFDLGDHQLRRFAGAAWLIPMPVKGPSSERVAWPESQDVIALGVGTIRRRPGSGGIAQRFWCDGTVEIGFRQPGLRCRPDGRAGHRRFKAIAQAFGVPPWQRPHLPIVFIDGQPAAIANCCVCEPFAAGPSEPGWLIEWDGNG